MPERAFSSLSRSNFVQTCGNLSVSEARGFANRPCGWGAFLGRGYVVDGLEDLVGSDVARPLRALFPWTTVALIVLGFLAGQFIGVGLWAFREERVAPLLLYIVDVIELGALWCAAGTARAPRGPTCGYGGARFSGARCGGGAPHGALAWFAASRTVRLALFVVVISSLLFRSSFR